MNLATSRSRLLSNLTEPYLDDFLALWNTPVEYTSIAMDIEPYVVRFTIIVEAPECPRIEFPFHTIPGGHA